MIKVKSVVGFLGRTIVDKFKPLLNVSSAMVAENASNGLIIASARVTNGNPLSTYNFTLNDLSGDFDVTSEGNVYVTSALNFEGTSSYNLSLEFTNPSNGKTYTKPFTITVGNINEPPVDITLTNNTIVTGLQTSGLSVGIASATDQDIGESIVYSLNNNAGGQFTINSSSGVVKTVSPLTLGNNTINIQATDSGNLSYSENFVINVNTVNQIILSSDFSNGDQFGIDSAISQDGNTVVIGANKKNSSTGAAYVFINSGGSWTQQAKLTPTPSTVGAEFGISVAISNDGNYIAVGAYLDPSVVSPAGAVGSVYIFKRTGSTWAQEARITPPNSTNLRFGREVDFNSDATYIAIGDFNDNTNYSVGGSVCVYTRSGTVWTLQQRIVPSDNGPELYFGHSCSISDNGDVLLVGAATDFISTGPGSAYIFRRSGSVWSQEVKLPLTGLAIDDFIGWSVTLSKDGNTAFVGGQYNDISNLDDGIVWVYTYTGSSWNEGTILPPDIDSGQKGFGVHCASSSNGNKLLIVAHQSEVNGVTNAGAVYAYERIGGIWNLKMVIPSPNPITNGFFGLAIPTNFERYVVIPNRVYTTNNLVYIYDLL